MRRFLAVAILLIPCVPAEVLPLTILHTNDLHARISPLENKHGGFAYLATVIRAEKANCNTCILLNAGDTVQGSPVSTIFHGLPVYEIANLLGFDAATLGNHEFDYGWMQVRKFIQIANYPNVSSNIVNGKGDLLTPKPYVILNVGKLRVGILGGMTESLRALSTPKALGEWHTIPVVATARRYAAELRGKTDIVVFLAHISPAEETQILNTIPDIQVQVTGHAHGGMLEPRTRDGRLQVRAKAYGEELGRLDLQVDTEKKAIASWQWKPITIDSTQLQPAPDVAALVKKWEDQVTVSVDQPLAISKRNLTKLEVKRLIEQAMREQAGVNFAHMNIGGVRDILPQGQLLVRHVWNIMPFDNTVLVGTFKGKDLPAVVVGDRKIDPNREYTLAVNSYTAENQETAENLGTSGLKFDREVGLLRDMLVDWIRNKKVID